jgi:hypothetical protein
LSLLIGIARLHRFIWSAAMPCSTIGHHPYRGGPTMMRSMTPIMFSLRVQVGAEPCSGLTRDLSRTKTHSIQLWDAG